MLLAMGYTKLRIIQIARKNWIHSGKGPLLRVQNTLIAEFSNIVDYVEKKGIVFSSHLTESQVSDMIAHLALIDHTLRLVEVSLFIWLP